MSHLLFMISLVLIGSSITVFTVAVILGMWFDPDFDPLTKGVLTLLGGGLYCLLMSFFVTAWGRG